MLASYRRVVKGTWPISFSFREYFSLRTWTQLFSFHKPSLSSFTVYTPEVKAACLTESSVTKSRQNILRQKTWVFNLVTLTTSYILLNVHLRAIRVNNQLDAIFNTFISLLHMFRGTQVREDLHTRRTALKKCVKLVVNTSCTEMHGQQNIRLMSLKTEINSSFI